MNTGASEQWVAIEGRSNAHRRLSTTAVMFAPVVMAMVVVASEGGCAKADQPLTTDTEKVEPAEKLESQYPGGCHDDTDNDGDQTTDCFDPDCALSPACKDFFGGDGDTTVVVPGGDNDPNGNSGNNTPGGNTDPIETTAGAPLPGVASFTLSYSLTLDFTGSNEQTVCASYGICDCSFKYTGSGTARVKDKAATSQEPGMAQYEGTWQRVSTDCSSTLADGMIWTPELGVKAYHTFFSVKGDGELVDSWMAHKTQAKTTMLETSAAANGQFFVAQMATPWPVDLPKFELVEQWVDASSALTPCSYVSTLIITPVNGGPGN